MTIERSGERSGSFDDVTPSKPLTNDEIARRGAVIPDDVIPVDEPEPITEPPLSDQISELVESAKILAEIEVAYYRAKLDANVSAGKKIFGLFGLGIAFGTAGLTALVLGALLTLSPLIGPGPATLLVAFGFCSLAGLLIWSSVRKARQLPLDSDKL